MNSSEYLEVCTAQYTVNVGFSEIFELKPVTQFHQASGCVCGPVNWMGRSLIFHLVPKVCSHDRDFCYLKAAIVVVICP